MSEEVLKNQSKSHKILVLRSGTASEDAVKLKLESIMSDVKTLKPQRNAPVQTNIDETVKLKRDFWVRQLQDVYNQIYETFVETLETCRTQYHSIYRNEGPPLTKAAKRMFRNGMRKQQKNMLQIIAELTNKDDSFLRNEENQAIANQFKTGILEMYGLLAILLSMEVNINKLETADKSKSGFSDNCQPLNEEIKKSTTRMQQLKAGSRLSKVIHDSMLQQGEQLQEAKQDNMQLKKLQVAQKNERENSQKNNDKKQLNFLRFSESLQEFNDQLHPAITSQKLTQPQNPQQAASSLQQTPDKLDIKTILKDFEHHKKNLEKMTDEFISEVGKPGFSFNKKYNHLQSYFEERYKLMGMYFGDPVMKDFMEQRGRAIERAKQLEEDKKGFVLENPIEMNTKFYQDLDASIQHFKNEKNEGALKRLGQLNQEIRNDLLEEAHNERMKQLNQIAIENTQQEWAISTNQKEKSTSREVQMKKHAETMKQKRLNKSKGGDSVDQIRSYPILSNSTLNFKSQSIQSSPAKQHQNQQFIFTERVSLPIKRNPIYRHSSYHENSSPAFSKQLIYTERKIQHPDCLKFAHVSHNSVPSETVSTLLKLKISEKMRKDKILSPNRNQNTDKILDFANSFQQNQKFTSTLTTFRQKEPAQSQQIESNEEELIVSPRISLMSQIEEMKLIQNKTRGDSPLYISKFNLVSNSRQFRERIKSQKQISRLNHQIPDVSAKLTPSSLSTSSAFSTTIQFSNSVQGNSAKSANFMNQLTQTRKGSQVESTISSNQLDKYKVVKDNNYMNNEEEKRKRRQIYDNEIPDMFRSSQQDLLFKINGSIWKSKEQKNNNL